MKRLTFTNAAISAALVLTVVSDRGAQAQTAQLQGRRAYACATADRVGFLIDKNSTSWRQAGFAPLRFTMVAEGNTVRLKKTAAKNEETYTYHNPWSTAPHIWQCSEQFYFLVFDEKLLRFTYSQMYAHIDNSTDTMVLAFGDCQRF